MAAYASVLLCRIDLLRPLKISYITDTDSFSKGIFTIFFYDIIVTNAIHIEYYGLSLQIQIVSWRKISPNWIVSPTILPSKLNNVPYN